MFLSMQAQVITITALSLYFYLVRRLLGLKVP
jgi:hypothetical protein